MSRSPSAVSGGNDSDDSTLIVVIVILSLIVVGIAAAFSWYWWRAKQREGGKLRKYELGNSEIVPSTRHSERHISRISRRSSVGNNNSRTSQRPHHFRSSSHQRLRRDNSSYGDSNSRTSRHRPSVSPDPIQRTLSDAYQSSSPALPDGSRTYGSPTVVPAPTISMRHIPGLGMKDTTPAPAPVAMRPSIRQVTGEQYGRLVLARPATYGAARGSDSAVPGGTMGGQPQYFAPPPPNAAT